MIAETRARPAQIVGPGAAAALVGRESSGRDLMVIDVEIVDRAAPLIADRDSSRVIIVHRPTDLDQARNLAQYARAEGTDRFIAVGGGNVLDLVKLSAAETTNPCLLRALALRATAKGFLVGTALPRKPLPFSAVPTTIGTGSEVNGSACFESSVDGSPAKTLVDLRRVSASAVAYDPAYTAAPASLLLMGLFEIAARLVGATVGTPSTLPLAELEAELLFDRVIRLAGVQGDILSQDEDRVEAALISAASHSDWALRGRGPAPSPLWIISTELSVAASISKNEAAMRLVVPWLTRVANGDERWGSPAAFAAWSDRLGDAGLVGWFARIVASAKLPTGSLEIDRSRVANRVTNRFGIGSLAGFDTVPIVDLLTEVGVGVRS